MEAKVRIAAADRNLTLLQLFALNPRLQRFDVLKELFNVSQVEIVEKADSESSSREQVIVTVFPADGIKCDRCWNYRTDTAQYDDWPVVCGRCRNALDLMGYKSLTESVERRPTHEPCS